ncbi:MAG: hypothetical protein IJE59_01145 [Clostridia bacterium]|nr:hypothetical protein [Clostridia bacterium]
MANGILDNLKTATQQVQEVAKMEAEQRSQYKDEVAKQFFELQKTVHSIISEEGIILKNFEWKKCNVETYLCYDEYISKIAKLFSYKYGFNEEIVLDLLITKNNGYAEKYAGEVHYITLVPKE